MKRQSASALARRYSSADIEQLRQMTRAARLHLIQGARQTEIAEKMGISQAGVSRLLRMAEEQGIIRSIVVPPDETMGRVRSAVNFVRVLQGAEEPLNTPDQALALMRIIDGAYRSAATGRPVAL